MFSCVYKEDCKLISGNVLPLTDKQTQRRYTQQSTIKGVKKE